MQHSWHIFSPTVTKLHMGKMDDGKSLPVALESAGERREKEDDCEFEAIGVVKIESKHWTCINVVFTITNQLVVIVNRKHWHHTCHV